MLCLVEVNGCIVLVGVFPTVWRQVSRFSTYENIFLSYQCVKMSRDFKISTHKNVIRMYMYIATPLLL